MSGVRPPNTGPGYDSPVPLRTLDQGVRFASYVELDGVWGLPDRFDLGTVLWVGPGSIEVWWDHKPKSSRVQPELLVYILDLQPMSTEQIDAYCGEGDLINLTEAAVAPINPTVKALIARYNFQLKQLQEALEGDDKAKASICLTRIDKAVAEARQLKIQLPTVPPALAEYAPLVDLLNEAAEKAQAEKTERENISAAKESNSTKHANRAVALERHNNEVKTAKAKTGGSTPKKDKVLRPCLDGCGVLVPGNFAMGHDAKLKSLLIKIERGDQPLEALPEVVMDLVKIVKGDAIQDRDSEGNAKGEPKQTYVIKAAPVRFPGRDDITLTKRDD